MSTICRWDRVITQQHACTSADINSHHNKQANLNTYPTAPCDNNHGRDELSNCVGKCVPHSHHCHMVQDIADPMNNSTSCMLHWSHKLLHLKTTIIIRWIQPHGPRTSSLHNQSPTQTNTHTHTSSSFRQPPSTRCSTVSAWHIPPSNLRCRWTNDMELVPKQFAWAEHANWLISSYTEDVSFWTVLGTLGALEALFLRRCAI